MSLFQLSRPRYQRVAENRDEQMHYATPRSSIYEVDDAYVIELDAPGVDQDSIEIRVEKNILTFTAERKIQAEENYRRMYGEFSSLHYQRRYDIGEAIDTERIEATYKNGVVSIHLPKRAEMSARRIKVSAG